MHSQTIDTYRQLMQCSQTIDTYGQLMECTVRQLIQYTDSWYNAVRILIQYRQLMQCSQTIDTIQTVDAMHSQTIDTIHRQLIQYIDRQTVDVIIVCNAVRQFIQCTENWYNAQTVDTTVDPIHTETVHPVHRQLLCTELTQCSQKVDTVQTDSWYNALFNTIIFTGYLSIHFFLFVLNQQ